jgi:hypothetical protein
MIKEGRNVPNGGAVCRHKEQTMELSATIQVIATSIAGFGLLLSAHQVRALRKQQRLSTLHGYWNLLWSDPKLTEMYYRIEYGEFTYDPTDFHRSDDEKTLDKLLGVMQFLALYYRSGLISKEELNLVHYDIVRILKDPSIQEYFRFLDGWCERNGSTRHPYKEAEELLNALEVDG